MGQYVTLMASLPALGPVLGAKRAPILRPRLEARLKLLAPEHRAELDALMQALTWRGWGLSASDAEFLAAARRTEARLASPTLRRLLRDRLELRTLVAALRRRAAGEGPPPPDRAWGAGRYLRRIVENWSDPGFGVAAAFPWVLPARDALERGATTALERLLLEAAWHQTERHGTGHDFDFDAVALYTVRWSLLDRWTHYDAEHAAQRFDRLRETALQRLPEALTPGTHRLEAEP